MRERRMAKALDEHRLDGASARSGVHTKDRRDAMSDNVAWALLVYTTLQIFVTVGALKKGSDSVLPYFALVVLVAAIIPACRLFERRWTRLGEAEANDPARAGAFRRDLAALWLLAIGLPLALTALFEALAGAL